MSGKQPPTLIESEEALVQLRVAHLTMIQGVISRLAGYSALLKNFCLTVVTATMALSVQHHATPACAVAGGAIMLFWLLDAYYLWLEQAFRETYSEVARRPFADAAELQIERGRATPWSVVSSLSLWGFYAPVLVVVTVLCYYL